ncbi:DUF5666 domain-containing protein [Patescibacteria group bacterium]|nr:DUF5666 domain-containing protein [Patescibacteria group bacterium]
MDKNTKTKAIILGVLILIVGGIIGFFIHTPTVKHHKHHVATASGKHKTTHKKHILVLSNIEGNISSLKGTTITINGTNIVTNKATKVFNGQTKIAESTLNNTQKVDVLGVHTKKGMIAKYIVVI